MTYAEWEYSKEELKGAELTYCAYSAGFQEAKKLCVQELETKAQLVEDYTNDKGAMCALRSAAKTILLKI